MIQRVGVVVVAAWVCLAAQTAEILYLGEFGGGAPAIETSFRAQVDRRLLTNQDVQLIDRQSTREFRLRLGPVYEEGTITRDLVDALGRHFGDSVIVVWTHITSYRIEPVRRWLVVCDIEGNLDVQLTMADLSGRGRVFATEKRITAREFKEHIPLTPLRKVHISAPDKTEMAHRLSFIAADHVEETIDAVLEYALSVRDEQGPGALRSAVENEPEQEPAPQPSIRDIFDVPVTEPADIQGDTASGEADAIPGEPGRGTDGRGNQDNPEGGENAGQNVGENPEQSTDEGSGAP